jgi:GT2 family glycosyltransferase
MVDISIIILTFNSERFLKACLDSVFTQASLNVETIVVDNASKDGTVRYIKENYPRVMLIENKENVGAIGGYC